MSPRAAFLPVSVGLLLTAVAGYWIPACAQIPAQSSDSLALLRQSQEAQREFERVRRSYLPTEFGSRRSGCDERIGRYCYWYEPSADSVPAEPERILLARRHLLDELRVRQSRLPADDWITGQLVRYLAEQSPDSAVIAAQNCRASRWWCDALEGFARHLAHDYQGAETAFGRALLEMPDTQRCGWNDLTPLLDDGGELYGKLPCAERDSVAERIWWLARPLYTRPGNDLKTEHYARQTMALLLQDAAMTDGLPWGDDRRQLGLRYGWPTHWSRAWDRPGSMDPPPILGHEAGPSFWLIPAPAVIPPWSDITQVRWDPGRERPPARYAPPYATGFGSIERVQFARFLRGDTTVSVAAFDMTGDSVFSTRPVDIRFAVTRDPTSVMVGPVSSTALRGSLSIRSLWRPAVLSLEALGVDTAWVARRRAMTAPDPGGLAPLLSDLLLMSVPAELPLSLDEALQLALGAPVVKNGHRVGLYWEMYDRPDSAVAIEIAVTRLKRDHKRELPYPVGRPSCPLGKETPVRLRWLEEPASRPRRTGRAVMLDLRPLSKGRYAIALQIRVEGRSEGCSSREIEIR